MAAKRWTRALAAGATAALLSGCGGGDGGDRGPSYTRLVSFGDSLSDVGTYRTAGMRSVYGGGQFTVNDYSASRPAAGTNWTEQLAWELALPTPCAARTGLNPPAGSPYLALAEATQNHAGCFNYAQGGARVTEPYGPGHPARLPADPRGYLGALTEPLTSQIAHHLIVAGGRFSAEELVTVLAGGNDALVQVEPLVAALLAGADPATISALATQAIQNMALAGTQLAALVQSLVLANGAQRVALVLLPDIGVTPSVLSLSAEQRAVISQFSQAFNAPLQQAFASEPRVLLVDAFTASRQQAQNPSLYGLANTTQPACLLSSLRFNSLFCSTGSVVAADVSRYWFADTVHLTPYGYQLLARVVTDAMTRAGWLAPAGRRPCDALFSSRCTLAPLP
jgi:phospholipase/lecithinase/hemolysin